ncbi:MAG TPA: zinc ribbon domain-containing protein [Candidatus Dormibacteraeota bacterium]|nr:zinc ribbon domain-containing protein [Candidatus Dormibacteraeota bacterium]
MVSEKVLRFQGKNKDLTQLSQQIVEQLQNEGYKVQSTTAPLGQVIQAQKAGILRDIITADRAFTITIAGQPNDFTVHVGIGKLIQNLAVAAIETLLLSALFLAVDVPEMLWTVHVESEIIKEIMQLVEIAPAPASAPVSGSTKSCVCGYQNPVEARFCKQCGKPLA